jgi:hypothetical protein
MANDKTGKKLWDEFDAAVDTQGLANDVKEAAENGGNHREVPPGDYEVEVNKMELTKSKSGKAMVTIWFKIVTGDYKSSLIFMNQVVETGFQIHIVDDILRGLVERLDRFNVKFENYNQYGNLIMDIFEAIDGNYEYAVNFEENSKGFNVFEIMEVFPLED